MPEVWARVDDEKRNGRRVSRTSITTNPFGSTRRGDYFAIAGVARDRVRITGRQRVIEINGTTMTCRETHRNGFREWLHARIEDWITWPIADRRRRIS